jgi:hypothetical protein
MIHVIVQEMKAAEGQRTLILPCALQASEKEKKALKLSLGMALKSLELMGMRSTFAEAVCTNDDVQNR